MTTALTFAVTERPVVDVPPWTKVGHSGFEATPVTVVDHSHG
jgi:hypothetical protein